MLPDPIRALRNSSRCNQTQSLSLRVVAYFAVSVEVHGCPVFSRVCGPMRQAVVIGISAARKIRPGGADPLRQSKCLRSASAVMVTDFCIVECERNFTSMERTGAGI